MNSPCVLGILGGLGPLCGASFYRHIILYTDAKCDADHIPVLLDGCSQTPDRSAFLCRDCDLDPRQDLQYRIRRLCQNGAHLIAVPCNTAHCFYRDLAKESPCPILHIVTETVAELLDYGAKSVGILGTRGSVQKGLYANALARVGIECVLPAEGVQQKVDALIRSIKGGILPKPAQLRPFFTHLRNRNCDAIVLGCTELSLCYPQEPLPHDLFDSLRILARRCVLACGKPLSAWAKKESQERPASFLLQKEIPKTDLTEQKGGAAS